MSGVEAKGLDRLCEAFNEAVKTVPELQRTVHKRLGDELQTLVRGNVRALLNERTGKVSGWQVAHIGSGGGYAAVRASETPKGRDGAGAVTNYLENGHEKRRSALYSRKERASIRMLRNVRTGNWVRGRGFYVKSRKDAPQLLQAAAEELAKQIADKLK